MFEEAEPIRLVIWDLDDTFWKGTLSEGRIEFIQQNRVVVRQLAQRGILSAICSKNNFLQVKTTLVAEGLWDYFIFPSVNWEPKGPRVKALIELAQLRPASVLLIDDNPSNLQEAKYFTPELQIAGTKILAEMLSHSAFEGRADPEMTRLAQYKSLEARRTDAASAASDAETFLRQSAIRVEIEHDLDQHMDRVIELINRTNQLNFTKARLPEAPAAARAALQALLHSHEIQAGLLHVADKYGDHGYAGFYALHNSGELLHFCFSCRLLGMGIETWLYRKLGRPQLNMSGEVLSDPVNEQHDIDWILDGISATEPSGNMDLPVKTSQPHVDWVAARGGCDLQALSHYFKLNNAEVIGEFNVGRQGFDARVDHSMFLHYALNGLAPEAIEASVKLGYRKEDFTTSICVPRKGRGIVVLSFWADIAYALYRHRQIGFTLPFALSGRADHTLDARTASVDDVAGNAATSSMTEALQTLQADYDFIGAIDESMFKSNVQTTLAAMHGPVVLLQANTRLCDQRQNVLHRSAACENFNRWLAETARAHPNAVVLDIRDVIRSEDEVPDWSHFDRIVYFRMYQRICQLLT